MNSEQRDIILTIVEGLPKLVIKKTGKQAEGETRRWRADFMALVREVLGDRADQIVLSAMREGILEFRRCDLAYAFNCESGDPWTVQRGPKAPRLQRVR